MMVTVLANDPKHKCRIRTTSGNVYDLRHDARHVMEILEAPSGLWFQFVPDGGKLPQYVKASRIEAVHTHYVEGRER